MLDETSDDCAPDETFEPYLDEPPPQATIPLSADVKEADVVTRVLGLLRPLNVYQRGERLMHIVRREPAEAGRIDPAHIASGAAFCDVRVWHLRSLIGSVCLFTRKTKTGDKVVPCPEWLPRMILERDEWPELRCARALVEWPALVGDETVTESGYDEHQRLVARVPESLAVTARRALAEPMTQERAQRALKLLLEPFSDFPLLCDQPDPKAPTLAQSALLSLILTLVGRNGYAGNTPLFIVYKNQKGAGGTMLVNAVSHMVAGRPVTMVQQPSSDDGEEERKQMMSVLMSGSHLALIDNVTRKVGGKVIDSFITSTAVSDRLLGGNIVATAPTGTVWCVSGNNITYFPDTTRRIIVIELDSPDVDPGERTGIRFPGPKLYTHIRANRPLYIAAALGVLRGYVAATKADEKLKPSRLMGSFEGWSELIAGALEWSGYPSPIPPVGANADPEKAFLSLLYSMWARTGKGQRGPSSRLGASALLRIVYNDEAQDRERWDPLREAIEDICGTPKQPSAKTLGHKFRHLLRQKFNTLEGKTQLCRLDGGAGGALWGFDSPGVKW